MKHKDEALGTPCYQHDSYHPECSDCYHPDPDVASSPDRAEELAREIVRLNRTGIGLRLSFIDDDVPAIAALLRPHMGAERDAQWLAFMESHGWDGAVAISKRDFLKLPSAPDVEEK